jgi:hypothetical protein
LPIQGFWYASIAVKKLQKLDKALEFLIKGSKIAKYPSLFLAEVVQILVSCESSNGKVILF